jgi:hypothetical protein
MRLVPDIEPGKGQVVTFVLAIGSGRQVCRLETTFQTQYKAFNYFRKHRTALERAARTSLACGEVKDGVVHLTML